MEKARRRHCHPRGRTKRRRKRASRVNLVVKEARRMRNSKMPKKKLVILNRQKIEGAILRLIEFYLLIRS